MYQIYTQKHQDAKVEIHLQGIPLLSFPNAARIGVGDKKKRYLTYLEKNFIEGKEMWRILCNVHAQGVQHGSIALLSHPKEKEFHADVLKTFLEGKLEQLNQLTPYVFPKDAALIKKIFDYVREQPLPEGAPVVEQPPVQLSTDDWSQINALIELDQAKEVPSKKINNSAISGTMLNPECDPLSPEYDPIKYPR